MRTEVERPRVLVLVAIGLLALNLSPTLMPAASSNPTDDRVDIELELEKASIVMPVSTQHITMVELQGWVDIIKKPPGETVRVDISTASPGQYKAGGKVSPESLYFFLETRLFFNLSITMNEDATPGFEYLLDIIGIATSKLGSDTDVFHLTIETVPELDGEALLREHPDSVAPGGSTAGVVQVTNLGTIYALFRLSVEDDPKDIIDSVDFRIEVELIPNWVEVVHFDINVARSAPVGEHTVTIGLNVVLDDGSNLLVDTYDVTFFVREKDGDTADTYGLLIVIGIIVASVVAALLLRRKS